MLNPRILASLACTQLLALAVICPLALAQSGAADRSIEEEMMRAAAQNNADAVSAAPEAKAPEPEAAPAGDDALIDDLMRSREEPPEPVAPTQPLPQPNPGTQPLPDSTTPPIKPMDIDLSVVGTAPALPGEAEPVEIRREGEIIVSRRGRIVRAPDANRSLFAFDSDGSAMADPPMILLPCQLLENMEQIITDRGDQTTFVLTGQVFTYHNVNFLMPTMMKIAVDKGNLN